MNTSDPVTVALTGQLPFVILLAAALALPVSRTLLWFYRRSVLKSMRATADRFRRDAPVEDRSLPPPAQTRAARVDLAMLEPGATTAVSAAAAALHTEALRAPWRAAAVYIIAGLSYATVMSLAFLLATGSAILPVRFLFLVGTYAWPAVLTVNLVAASSRRATLTTGVLYLAALLGIGLFALARSSTLGIGQLGTLWIITNAPATVLLLAFLNRRVRAVGPLVLTFMVVAVLGANVTLSVAGSDEGRLRSIVEVSSALGLGAVGTFLALLVVGFVAFGLVGWVLLAWIRVRYQAKRLTDQSIMLDAIWLLFGVTQSVGFVFEGAIWILSGLVAFGAYTLVVGVGFAALRRERVSDKRGPRLLLLRVFSLGKRSERLFDALATHWRYVGSLQLIAGPDLATSTVEPHEFLDFVSGRLARRFIDAPEALDRRLAEMDLTPDHDGRFRVTDFFCHADSWKMVLSRLVRDSDAVLMDLRGFSAHNAGCVYEVSELINVAPLRSVVFAIDETTDLPFLEQRLRDSASVMRPDSPNFATPSVRAALLRLSGSHVEVSDLLGILCSGATSAAGSVALTQQPVEKG